MADGLIALGVSFSSANKLTAQTVIGAAKMVLDTGKHPAMLRDEVGFGYRIIYLFMKFIHTSDYYSAMFTWWIDNIWPS